MLIIITTTTTTIIIIYYLLQLFPGVNVVSLNTVLAQGMNFKKKHEVGDRRSFSLNFFIAIVAFCREYAII